jgi:hypothetical protein
MCATCGCNHINYQHEMPKNVGTKVGNVTEKVNYNMPSVPAVPAMPRSMKGK